MNHLAHVALSGSKPEVITGNLIADFLRKKEQDALPFKYQIGLELHRLIDMEADSSPAFKRMLPRLYPNQGKYSSVVLDVYFDVILARYWSEYRADDLRTFSNEVYKVLERQMRDLPEIVATRLSKMIANDWLYNYQFDPGMQRTFEFLHRRARFQNTFLNATEEFLNCEPHLKTCFSQLWDELNNKARKKLQKS